MAYLDKSGLEYLWGKIKTKLAGKVDVEDGKGLSTNDFTETYKNQLDGIADFDGSYDSLTDKPIIESVVTETSDKAVKSSGIYNYVNSSLGGKVNSSDYITNSEIDTIVNS